MSRRIPSTLALLVLGLVLLPAGTARAQDAAKQTVHRCIGRHGEIVFSGFPCAEAEAAPGASSAPASGATDPVRRAVDMTCPATRDLLRERIEAAVARHDSNLIASVLRWRGVGAAAAGSRLRELASLTRGPLLALEEVTGTDPDGADRLRLRTGSNLAEGTREHAFGVAVEGGCYWLVW